MFWRISAIAVMCSIACNEAGAAEVRRTDGGSIQTPLSSTIIVNKGSTLRREWITINDPSLPAEIVNVAGVATKYESGARYSSGRYIYKASYTVSSSVDLAAIEVRFLTFDIWGNHVRTLSATEVKDLKAGTRSPNTGEWNVFSETEVAEHYASIAYISHVRTSGGKVFTSDVSAVLDEAKKFTERFTAADLEPSKDEGK